MDGERLRFLSTPLLQKLIGLEADHWHNSMLNDLFAKSYINLEKAFSHGFSRIDTDFEKLGISSYVTRLVIFVFVFRSVLSVVISVA